MRDRCIESENIVSALVAGMIGRTVAGEFPASPGAQVTLAVNLFTDGSTRLKAETH